MLAWKGLFVYFLCAAVLCRLGVPVFKVMPDHSLMCLLKYMVRKNYVYFSLISRNFPSHPVEGMRDVYSVRQ